MTRFPDTGRYRGFACTALPLYKNVGRVFLERGLAATSFGITPPTD